MLARSLKMEEEERHLQRERDQRDLEARIRNEQN
jgi:DNA-directed RNA polymerase subunit omega